VPILALILSLLLASPGVSQNPQTPPVKGTGRISGQVADGANGKPIAGASVRMVRWEGGLGSQSYGRTDADGRFTFPDLRPGSYQINVTADRYVGLEFGQRAPGEPGRRIELGEGVQFDKADFALPRTSAVEGRLVDEFGDPVPGVTVLMARVFVAAGKRRLAPISLGTMPTRPTDDLGQFRVFNLPPGDYYVLAVSGPFAGADDPSGFAPTFYPGTRVATQAQPIHLDSGRDVRDVSFVLAASPMATMSGSIVDASGQPVPGANLMLYPTTGGDIRLAMMARLVADADGSFTFRNVTPGAYVIQAFGRPQGGGNLARAPFGSLALDVPDGGRSDLVVQIGGATARGHISFEGTATPPRPGVVLVFPQPADFITAPAGGGPPQTVTHDDWTFEVSNMSGRRVIRVTVGGPWVLKRVTLDGRDITDEPVDFRTGDINGLEVTLTSSAATVTGTVTDGGAPAAGYGVLVFSDDQTKWTFPSRFIAAGGPNQQGVFRVTGLPPGSYRVIALPANEVADAQEPETLVKLVPLSTGVVIGEGETQTVTLKLTKR